MIDHRTGRFTSSGIHVLVNSGRGNIFSAPALAYINDKRLERKLQRSLGGTAGSMATRWGNLMEKVVWEYHYPHMDLISKDYRFHPSEEFSGVWSGIPDLELKGQEIGEIKCYQLKKFAEYGICLMQKNIELFKSEFPQEYWQIVSNTIINKVKIGSAISFMPYRDELETIIYEVENSDMLDKWGFKPWEYRFLVEDSIDGLPYIEHGGYFNHIIEFKFEVPQADKDFLEERVRLAKKLLLKP
jgi:hypothetical protein